MSTELMGVQPGLEELLEKLALGITSPYRELTLKDAHAITGISPDNLKRRWKFDPDWHDAVYAVGKLAGEYRTTLDLIHRCQKRSAATAKARELEKRKSVKR